jgi:hypothetical protein
MMGILSWFRPKNKAQNEIQTTRETCNLPLTKYYAFNETGNIMVSTTREGSEVVNDALKVMFLDMSIFFAAMTKAIVTRENEKGEIVSSIYNSDDISKILDKSEFFVEVRQETVTVSSSEVGDKMSKELTEKILGRKFEENRLNFARGMFYSMSKTKNNKGSGSIFFICESILGLPMVSAMVIKLIDSSGEGILIQGGGKKEGREMEDILKLDESEGTNTILRKWNFEKNTYVFVSPRTISNANFPSPGDSLAYENLVKTLKEHLS